MRRIFRALRSLLVLGRGIISLLLCIVVASILLSLDNVAKERFHVAVLSTILYPAQLAAGKIQRIRDLSEENEKLLADNAALRLENDLLSEASLENNRLRSFLGFKKRGNYPLVLAQVLSLNPGRIRSTALINRGERDGVLVNMPVLTPSGLVGRIVKVHPFLSVLEFLNSPSTKVSVMDRRSRTIGILQSVGGMHPHVEFPAHADISRGDTLITSGYGAVFPKGLRVGIVDGVDDGDIPVMQKARVKLFQHPGYIEEVFLLPKEELWQVEVRK